MFLFVSLFWKYVYVYVYILTSIFVYTSRINYTILTHTYTNTCVLFKWQFLTKINLIHFNHPTKTFCRRARNGQDKKGIQKCSVATMGKGCHIWGWQNCDLLHRWWAYSCFVRSHTRSENAVFIGTSMLGRSNVEQAHCLWPLVPGGFHVVACQTTRCNRTCLPSLPNAIGYRNLLKEIYTSNFLQYGQIKKNGRVR